MRWQRILVPVVLIFWILSPLNYSLSIFHLLRKKAIQYKTLADVVTTINISWAVKPINSYWHHQRQKLTEELGQGPEGLLTGASLLTRPADEFENDPSIELMWAKKACEHADIYFNILCSVDPTLLKLTPNDEEIYTLFREEFKDFNVEIIDEDEMKSIAGKEKWRKYCEKFKDKVEDYSFGTLLRKDCTEQYTENNSILVTRIQFLAIELARNRESYNNCIRSKFKPNSTKN